MKLSNIHSVFFIGIGGIGMSALARWFHQRGVQVAGYDRVETELCRALMTEGIDIHFTDDVSVIPEWARDAGSCLVVYTPAVPDNHSELTFFRSGGHQVKKRSEVLGIITQGHYTIAVAGTHGKTTTSSMIAHLLAGSEQGCSAFVGGIMTNYRSNLIVGDEHAPVVVEADEFDRSFLRLHPDLAIVTSLDPDHLDIYESPEKMIHSYADFVKLTSDTGQIFLQHDVAVRLGETLKRKFTTYALEGGEIHARHIHAEGSRFVFDYVGEETLKGLKLALPGFHNVSNALAAITVALQMKMDAALIRERLDSYRGVKRRFEYIVERDDLVYIDDYAHHPSEIEALLLSVRELYPGKKITTIFQPHLYSRTRDFYRGFAKSLSLADEVILMDIYPAREEPIPGVSSDMIFERIEKEDKYRFEKPDFPEVLSDLDPEVLVTAGAGDIDTIVPKIKHYYSNHQEVEA